MAFTAVSVCFLPLSAKTSGNATNLIRQELATQTNNAQSTPPRGIILILPKVTPLNIPYTADIRGYGEIYEMESVHHLQRRFRNDPPPDRFRYLFTLPNRTHNGKFGMTLTELVTLVTHYYNAFIVSYGFIDSPPWKSYRQSEVKEIFILKRWIASIIFRFMVYFERPSSLTSHMIYVIADTPKPIKVAPDIENTVYWQD